MQKQATKTRESAKAKAARIAAEQAAIAAQAEQAEQAATANLPAIAQAENTSDDSAQAEQAATEKSKAEIIAESRALAAAIFATLADSVSIPIKTTRAFKLNRDLQPHAIGRKPSARQAAAIVIALAASKQRIENGAIFARSFTMRGDTYAIENGCAADFLRAGLATYDSATESFTVANAAEIRAQLGKAIAGFNI